MDVEGEEGKTSRRYRYRAATNKERIRKIKTLKMVKD